MPVVDYSRLAPTTGNVETLRDVTTTELVVGELNDGWTETDSVDYPPSHLEVVAYPFDAEGWVRRWNDWAIHHTEFYRVGSVFLRWDTRSIPDDHVIASAELDLDIVELWDNDAYMMLCADYFIWQGELKASHMRVQPAYGAIHPKRLDQLDLGINTFTLRKPHDRIEKDSSVGVRLHIEGGHPNGPNGVKVALAESFTLATPVLRLVHGAIKDAGPIALEQRREPYPWHVYSELPGLLQDVIIENVPAVNTAIRLSFPTPVYTPTPGAERQEFRIPVRKKGPAQSNPVVRVELFETGGTTPLATVVPNTPVTSTVNQELVGTWDAALLAQANGSAVEARVVGTGVSEGSVEVSKNVRWRVYHRI